MTVVSSKQFATNQKKFYTLALNEQVAIKRGKNIFYLSGSSIVDDDTDEDVALLALAKSRMMDDDDETMTADELINYLRK